MNEMERRMSRRFNMNLPLMIRFQNGSLKVHQEARTRDVSFRGLYFVIDSAFQAGMPVEFVLTLPKEVTMTRDVNIHCFGRVIRVEPQRRASGVAARIERYEFLPSST